MAGLCVRSVLVMGANRGIGLELVRKLLGKGKPPEWVFATCQEPAGERAQGLKTLASRPANLVILPLDVTHPASIHAAAARVQQHLKGSGLTLLINNAGTVTLNTLESEMPEGMALVYATNVTGPQLVSQAFLPLLKKAAQGSPERGLRCSRAAIVNMSSEAGSIASLFAWHHGQAPLAVDSSVRGILDMLPTLSKKDNGAFVSWEGKVLPW